MNAYFNLLMAVAGKITKEEARKYNANENSLTAKLPERARRFLANYFPEETVTVVEHLSGSDDKSYGIRLASGIEIVFDNRGEWTIVDSRCFAIERARARRNEPTAVHAAI